MLTMLLLAALASGPAVMGPSLNLAGSSPSPVAGAVDWSKCADGSSATPCAGQTTATKGGEITFTRNATEFCGDSTLYAASANSPCVGSSAGAGVWSAAASGNLEPFSATFTSGTFWNSTASGNTTAPNGTNTADVWTGGTQIYCNAAYCPAVADGVLSTQSIWAKTDSGTCDFNYSFTNTATWNGATVYGFTATTAWQRFSFSGTHAAGTGKAGLVIGTYAAGTGQTLVNAKTYTGCTLHLWGPSVVLGGAAGPYCATAGTVCTGTATTASVVANLTSASKWAIGLRATPSGGWARAGGNGLLQWGGSYGAANSVSVYVDASAKLILEVFDAAGTPDWRRWTSTDALSGTTAKSIIVANAGGTWTVTVDGTAIAGGLSGTGTGVQTALPTATIGIGTVGSSVLNGFVSSVCQAKTTSACARALK